MANLTPPPAPLTRSWPGTLGWAAYLACSWTWCIGMFLPVLLVRDYGVWGFVVFAVPNVLGAGAMGWVLRSPGASERIVAVHGPALRLFSFITILFHCAFFPWLLNMATTDDRPGTLEPFGDFTTPVLWIMAGLVLMAAVWLLWRNRVRSAASLTLAASAAVGVVLMTKSTGGLGDNAAPAFPSIDLLWLAPVCAFGFALCPYLDLTFHRVVRSLPHAASRAAFTLGFGVLFPLMLGVTLLYTPWLARNSLVRQTVFAPALLSVLLVAHILWQSVFTVFVHNDETALTRRGRPWRPPGIGIPVVIVLFTGLWAFSEDALGGIAGLTLGELIYRLFMTFYGLIFPAYVWLCMIPTPDGHSGTAGPRGRFKLGTLALVCAAAAPFYWMGFIERKAIYLVPGLLIVLLARLAVRGRTRAKPDTVPT